MVVENMEDKSKEEDELPSTLDWVIVLSVFGFIGFIWHLAHPASFFVVLMIILFLLVINVLINSKLLPGIILGAIFGWWVGGDGGDDC